MRYRTSTAIALLVLMLSAWGLVGFFAWTINTDEAQRIVDAQNSRIAAVTGAQAVRTHAIVQDTAEERAALQNLLNVDVVSASYMIEEVGKIAGVKVKLSDAQPENLSTTDPLALKTVGFVISVDGKFSALMRTVRLFENLPIPSSVSRLDIEHAPKSAGDTSSLWHMNVYLRVLTTSDISS